MSDHTAIQSGMAPSMSLLGIIFRRHANTARSRRHMGHELMLGVWSQV